MGSGIKWVGSGIRRVGSGIAALGSGITDRGIAISSFLRDQGSGCTIFVGSRTKIGLSFGIKDQKFAYENGINIEKTYLVTTLQYFCIGRYCSLRISAQIKAFMGMSPATLIQDIKF